MARKEIYTHENPLRVFEAFAGYGSQSLALERLKRQYPGFDYKPVGFSEIDKYAITAYHTLHGDDVPNYGDISKIDWDDVPDFDLFTMSSPCQDFSSAGLQRGGEEGSGTRSSLLWECTKAIEIKRPKYILFENVPALVSKKFIDGFNKWKKRLEGMGYLNYSQLLNAKDFGIAQNRLRIFMVSVREDVDCGFQFPKPWPLEQTLDDVLEDEVDRKYYLSHERIEGLLLSTLDEMRKGRGYKFTVKKKVTSPSASQATAAVAERPTTM